MPCCNFSFSFARLVIQIMRFFLASAVAINLLFGCGHTEREDGEFNGVLRLATTTSTRDSGLLDELLPDFEREHKVRVDVIAVGTGKALKLGEAGDVDVVLVHAREAEDAFLEAGHAVRREDVMYNTFEIIGPADDPAKIRGLKPAAALRKIADEEQRFVSRGDESGTHRREMKLWEAAKGLKEWDSYSESGQGMGATLIIADEMNAYVLADRGTFLRFKSKIELIPLVTEGKDLHNPYGVLTVNPKKNSAIRAKLSDTFADFLISPDAQEKIGEFKIDGEVLFSPMHIDNN